MATVEPSTDELLGRAGCGDRDAREQLLERHRRRLVQMVAVRLDERLKARLDPSDVVQEALMDADRDLSDFLRERPVPYYVWLRQLTWQRLVKLHQHHQAGKRQVSREQQAALSGESAAILARRLLRSGASPSNLLVRKELRRRVQEALNQLAERDREVLVLRYLEGLSTKETAAVLGIREGAAKVRHLRALERLRGFLGDEFGGAPSC
jgi:RNA polymerase sigma-70 factor (ECF subfamily)